MGLSKLLSGLFLSLAFSQLTTAASGGGGSSPYVSMDPSLVVNVVDGKRVRHMQVDIQLKLDKPESADTLKTHLPAIRHEIVMLLSDREVKLITTPEGKEQLRQEVLEAVKKTSEEVTGGKLVEGLYFTSFIIQ